MAPRFRLTSQPSPAALPALHFSRLLEAARRLACIPSLYMVLFAMTLARPVLPGGIYIALVAVLIAGAWKLPRTDYRLFLLYILGFSLFLGLRVYGDQVGIPVSYVYPIEADRALFGVVPTNWLQDRFYTAGQTSTLDWVTIVVYSSYFMGHFWLGLLLWAFKRHLLLLHVVAVTAAFMIGLVFYYLVPTSPPWLAGETDHLPEVTRIVHVTMSENWAAAEQQGTFIAGRNDVAAMPSLHTAITVVLAIVLWRVNRLLGIAGWVYAFAMSFSLMYLGEHYFIDIFCGFVLAAASYRLTTKLVSKWTRRADAPAADETATAAADRTLAEVA